MSNLKVNDKLYNWRYGAMTIIGFRQDYIDLRIDDLENVVNDEQNNYSKELNKTYLLSSINHWIHMSPINAIDNDNDFDFPGKPDRNKMILDIDKRFLHLGLKETIKSEIAGLISAVQIAREFKSKQIVLKTNVASLKDSKVELEVIKKDENNFKDHEEYRQSIKKIDEVIISAQTSVELAETDLNKHLPKFDGIIIKYELSGREIACEEVESKLKKLLLKTADIT